MTVHKLTAGDGYTYLTRQVASCDEARPQGQSLADYYAACGNPPGVWLGQGSAQLGVRGQQVTEAQMRSLFGAGLHPDAEAMLAAGAIQAQTRLGRPFPVYADLAPYAKRVAEKAEEFTTNHGRPPSEAERNQIAAKEAHRGRRAVAGFDLVFTPVKSTSLLWGLSSPEVRCQAEDAHHAAVASALAWIEKHASFTRTGRGGVAQVDATGLVCAAFDHRESRSGDPDLHTHVAIANKVCGPDGKWRSLDARGLFGLGVAASEHYNTRLEDELSRRLGVRFEDRGDGSPDKRPVREVVGMPRELVRHFSRRRAAIAVRLDELTADYRERHGREPDRATSIHLAQQATLETREGKPPGRTLAEQVTDWRQQAAEVLGPRALDQALSHCIGQAVPTVVVTEDLVRAAARHVVREVSERRSTWTIWNAYAEAERVLRPLRFASTEDRQELTQAVVARATGPELSIRIAEPELIAETPSLTRPSDGQSVFIAHGTERFTTSTVLLAEDSLIAAGRSGDADHCDDVVVQAALAIHESRTGLRLDSGQRALVEAFAGSAHRLVVGIGPAGAGKTTAMRAFADVWETNGGRVIPLATSAKAAQVLGDQLGGRSENLHKFLFEHQRLTGPEEDWYRLRSGDLVLVDEAGMAGTLQLARLTSLATEAGASIRLLGDPAQLAAVDAGGVLQLLEHEVGATYLTDLHRFTDPHEARASLLLRDGNTDALTFYSRRHRIRSGTSSLMLERAYAAWAADDLRGSRSVLIAATTADVTTLNARARRDRVQAGDVERYGAVLRDGNFAGVGDRVVTRENARTLRFGRGQWVHNGDTWHVLRRHRDGALTLRHLEGRGKVRVAADYVADALELAYASTAHRVQGTTTDTAHALVTPEMTREGLYVASTRGRSGTTWYVATEASADIACDHEPGEPRTALEVLTAVLARKSTEGSATEALRQVQERATTLPELVRRYDHALTIAAETSLASAVEVLPAAERERIIRDPGYTHLAKTLANAASRGADPRRLLRAAHDFEPLTDTRSPALVVAQRIQDTPRTLGVPNAAREPGPLPWLAPPDVGHPTWHPYLTARAGLISSRLKDLGSLAAAYREQYEITGAGGLGEAPELGTRQAAAHQHAIAEDATVTAQPTVASPATPVSPPRSARTQAVHRDGPYRGY